MLEMVYLIKRLSVLVIAIVSLHGISSSQVLYDSFGKLIDDDVYTRIDLFGSKVEKKPETIGHMVIYKAQNQPLGAYLRYIYGFQDVWKSRGYPVNRLVLHSGQEKKELHHDFWILGKGEVIRPKEFSIGQRLVEQLTEKTLFDRQCIGCDPAVFLHQWIFREGLDYYGKALVANKASRAEITIGVNEFVSGTKRERKELISNILKVLTKKYTIPNSRITIRFTKSMFAKFYIIPNKGRA